MNIDRSIMLTCRYQIAKPLMNMSYFYFSAFLFYAPRLVSLQRVDVLKLASRINHFISPWKGNVADWTNKLQWTPRYCWLSFASWTFCLLSSWRWLCRLKIEISWSRCHGRSALKFSILFQNKCAAMSHVIVAYEVVTECLAAETSCRVSRQKAILRYPWTGKVCLVHEIIRIRCRTVF